MYQHSETLKIGKIYKGIREAMGLSQEDVSAGLMSAKALSRFENDENYPNSYMMQILFERVGKSLRHFIFMLSKSEYEYHLWRRDTVAQILYIMLFIKDIKVNISIKNYIGSFVLFGKVFWTII